LPQVPDHATLRPRRGAGATDVAERLEPEELAQLTSTIVAAYVTGNPLPASDLPRLIDLVGGELRQLGQAPAAVEPSKPEPAVSVRRSIAPDRLTCLVCGKTQKTLRRHLSVAHDLTPAAYREMFELKPDYPMVAPSYSRQRSELAQRLGLGRRQPPPPRPRRRRRSTASAGEAPPETEGGGEG
jgi:predicted transcriptional regulator